MARSVEDCALLLNAMAGHDRADPTTSPAPVPDFTGGLGDSVRGRTIGVPTSVFFEGADPETATLVHRAEGVFSALGARVVPVEVPSTQRISGTAYIVIQLTEPLAAHEHYLRQRPQDYQGQTLALFGLGAAWTGQHYVRAQRIRTINIREWLELFGKVDAVLCPTTPRPAPTKQEAQATGVIDLVNYTSFFDFNGCPSISVPAGFTGTGLPVGLMLSARPFDEPGLLRLAHAYQEATGFNRRRPSLA
jgi:aspartyl-tRNA(Asn)/glutamyl-tRNA(Gln) amidotransferase subunit A